MTNDITKRPPNVAYQPAADSSSRYLLEMFEQGDGPLRTRRHAIWLHILKAGGYRWKCSCGMERAHYELDAALLAEARAHFDQAWEPAAVPIGSSLTIWNDRVTGDPPPSAADLKQLAKRLVSESSHGR